jgi:mannose-6-phosphate isomerase-like protein (cupin superfamily)
MADRVADLRVLRGVRAAVRAWPGSAVDAFRSAVDVDTNAWTPVEPETGPAARLMEQALGCTAASTYATAAAFAEDRATRKWEQTYARGRSAALDRMLDAYGFAEIIGPYGPFVSDRVRVAMALWGADIVYPRHRHAAEEMYLVCAGGARFTVGAEGAERTFDARAGDAVHIPSDTPHGFVTAGRPIAVLAIWLAAPTGDLRAPSTVAG